MCALHQRQRFCFRTCTRFPKALFICSKKKFNLFSTTPHNKKTVRGFNILLNHEIRWHIIVNSSLSCLCVSVVFPLFVVHVYGASVKILSPEVRVVQKKFLRRAAWKQFMVLISNQRAAHLKWFLRGQINEKSLIDKNLPQKVKGGSDENEKEGNYARMMWSQVHCNHHHHPRSMHLFDQHFGIKSPNLGE